ncbi:nitroreductase family protein [uncultured Victivallis sp.]|uniref:nitroreductase family protein n=1 Tax=uncultured Victivallis sp. TaxID=354118 RepID=UPI0025E0303F|nr:nitroreductase family protein [uncultured Victivallis sp.]
MDFYEVVSRRRSIRHYADRPVSDESLRRIAHAVSLAPTACNRQAFKIQAVRNPEIRAAICAACPQRFLPEAPVILVALGNAKEAWRRAGDDHSIIEMDLGIVLEHAILAATAEGLASCWVCGYDLKKMNEALKVEAPWSALALAPLGYAATEAAPLQRKPEGEIFEIID